MPANHYSPFVVGRPLRADEPIFGRAGAFQFIHTQLSQYSSVNIVGERRMGKTSLINHLLGNEAKYVPLLSERPLRLAHVDLQGDVADAGRFYGAALRELLPDPPPRRSEQAWLRQLRDRLLARPTCEADEFHRALRHLREVSGVRPVLVVDEFEQLLADGSAGGFPYPAFFNNLRALIGDRHELLAMVIASRCPLAEYFNDPRRPHQLTSTFPNYFQPFRLEPLADADADALLRQGSGLQLAELRAARAWAQGHPCHLQAAGEAWAQTKQRQESEQWARARFGEIIKQSCLIGTARTPPVHTQPRRRYAPRLALCLLLVAALALTCFTFERPRRALWSVPLYLGQMIQGLGNKFDDLIGWSIGAGFILLALLLLFGLLTRTEVANWFKKIFGIGQ